MDWKLDLYRKIAPHRRAARDPRLQHLGPVDHQAERGAARGTQAALLRHPLLQSAALHVPGRADPDADDRPEVLDQLETFVTTGLGKGVVRAKDTPNFIANRVGIAGMLATMHEAEKFGLAYDVVDDLTGKKMGRASSGTFRTADVVGLDTMAHVIKTLQDNLQDDPVLRELRDAAGAGQALIEKGALGQKSRRRLLQEGRQGHPAPRCGERRVRARGREGRRGRRPHAEEAAGRAAQAAARVEQPAGAVPVGDPARRFHYVAVHLADDRRDRARRGLRDALGLRHEARARSSCGRRPAGSRSRNGCRKTSPPARRCRQRAAAGLGLRGPGRGERGRAHAPRARGAPRTAKYRAAPRAAGLCAAVLPRQRARQPRPPIRRRAGTTVHEDDSMRLWTLERRCRRSADRLASRPRCTPSARA